MLYSETRDRYYSDPEEAEDELEDGEALEDLRIVICEPQCAPSLEADWFTDVLPSEDYDVPDALLEAIDTFNATMNGVVLSWVPGKTRLKADE